MEAAVGAASWLLGKALAKLSNELVAAFVASSELGRDFQTMRRRLLLTQGLLHAAQARDVSNDPGLYGLLADLSKKTDEAEDALDEIHYFMIQDQLDGTSEAVVQEPASRLMGSAIRSHALHGCHAIRHTIGNWLPCFLCWPTHHDDPVVDVVSSSSNPHDATHSGVTGARLADKLSFDRVAMSSRIKCIIEEMNSICEPLSDLLKIANESSTTKNTVHRPPTSSLSTQDRLYGRDAIFEKTVRALTSNTYHSETLSVLPFVGPGGIGKTTFTQRLYNDKRTEGNFTVRVWVCVSTNFDVLNLTREIYSCIPATEKEVSNFKNETSNLDQLQKCIAERLKSKRFLVVLDDIWKCNSESDWNNLLAPFRKGEIKGSMVLVTTRFPFIAHMVKTTDPVELKGLGPDVFFELFEACIFGHNKPSHYEVELIDVARDIAKKLKGSPLAANTVGRLLRKNLSWEYWIGVLEKNEWKNTTKDDDIMPILKISYDYLPFLLKKCFSYCSLFPEDYKFYNLEITNFWTAIGILDSSCKNDKNYFKELVDNGFLMKGNDRFCGQYYVMHDLLHELSHNVSSQECINISNLSFSVDDIPKSVQHLSVTIDNKYDESFGEKFGKLKSIIDIKNLRTLMIFGHHEARIVNIFENTFEDIKGLRVLFIAMRTKKSLPKSFSNLIHLQYLRISSRDIEEMTLPTSLSRFYHLKFLDLKHWQGSKKLPEDISRLVNLRHFHTSKELHSNIPGVGKMKFLQELKEFHVKKKNTGFELRELGELGELRGELCICNLENVASKGEASAAKLEDKKNLKELKLVWSTEHQTTDDNVLDGLQPHPNLRVLGIINAGVVPCPRWLCGDISTKHLESLHLEGISWGTLPPFEQLQHLTKLTMNNIAGMSAFGPGFSGVTDRSFMRLKKIEFRNMRELVEWVGEPNSHLFSRLESIEFIDCPILSKFPFMECSDCFTNLRRLCIVRCPKISQLPPLPHNSALKDITVGNDQSKIRAELRYDETYLSIEGYKGDLAFHNLDKVDNLYIMDVSHISLLDLQMLNSLRSVYVSRYGSMFSAELDASVALHSVQELSLAKLNITGEVFSNVLRCFPALSKLRIINCEILELLPMEDGGGLWDLTMLQTFEAWSCHKLFSRFPMGEVGRDHTIKPFPSSLKELVIRKDSSFKSMALLSNLRSLTHLRLEDCEELTMDGFNPVITVNLKKLHVFNKSLDKQKNSIAGDLLSEVAKSGLIPELEEVEVDSISAMLVAPICSHLASTLGSLMFSHDMQAATFTEAQEQALQLLTSLDSLKFTECCDLKSLPRCDRLSSLTQLVICECGKIRSLPPKEHFPVSLKSLYARSCSPELEEDMKKLQIHFPSTVSVLTLALRPSSNVHH